VSDADSRVRLAVAIIRALRVVVWCVAHVPPARYPARKVLLRITGRG
jgi:hypothetical protein